MEQNNSGRQEACPFGVSYQDQGTAAMAVSVSGAAADATGYAAVLSGAASSVAVSGVAASGVAGGNAAACDVDVGGGVSTGSFSGVISTGVVAAGGGAADAGPSSSRQRKRHNKQQTNALEAYFKNRQCPNKEERIELARSLGMTVHQVKIWFQNRRSHRKIQIEREENVDFRTEIDSLRARREQLIEARNNYVCQQCSDKMSQLISDHIRIQQEGALLASKLQSYMVGQKGHQNPLSSTSNASSGKGINLISEVPISDKFRQPLIELVMSSAEELKVMALTAEPLWIPSGADSATSVLNQVEYLATIPNNFGPTRLDYSCEASRHIARVSLNPRQLLNTLMNVNEWTSMFSSIVSKARTLAILNEGIDHNTTLQLMAAEYHIPTPLVSNRDIYFARYCTQHSEGVWVVVDVSVDNILPTPEVMTCQKKASGCLIQETADGTSKITWIEHVYVDYNGVSTMYKRLLLSGLGLGAKRWVSTLQRQCQRLATTMSVNIPSPRDVNNLLMSSPEGRTGLLKLAERMSNNFFFGITGPRSGQWTTLRRNFNDNVRFMTMKVMDESGLPNGTLLSATTSFVLPLAPNRVFDFFHDLRFRKEWDIFANKNDYESVFHISFDEEAGNSVTIYKVPMRMQGHMLVIQESWRDAVASHIVFARTEIGPINMILGGGNPDNLSLVPSGFTILPDGPSYGVEGSSRTLLTASFQILGNNSPMADIDLEGVTKVAQLLRSSCENIKRALGALGTEH